MEHLQTNPKATFESVWAALQETDRLLKEGSARFEKDMQESREEYRPRIKKSEELTGSWANNHGSFAEEYF